ncbi:MAG: T9SS type A sorting domain-containing protein [Saprospiraceae bacterium]|nr:T9SS type A sorting domain-containing protein [Saprospiraceae bacterium]MDW8230570.1 T9SS type A sorting domain-containing protein [Saprospiraceae bacterium]
MLPFDQAKTQPQKIIVGSYIEFTEEYAFAPGSDIVLLNGALLWVRSHLSIEQSALRGCGSPWHGIRVEANGILQLKGNAIANSCEGVILLANSKAEIAGNQFNDTYTCVQAYGAVTLTGDGIAYNIFDGSAIQVSGCSASAPAAIRLSNVPQITIGNVIPDGIPNQVIGYLTGIRAANSNLDVVNTVFRASPTGTAISLNGSDGTYSANIIGVGSAATSPATISNYGFGISSRNYNVSLKDAYLKKVQRGVSSLNNAFPVAFDIRKNRFEAYNVFGIYIVRSPLTQVTIRENIAVDNSEGEDGLRNWISWQKNTLASLTGSGYIYRNKFYDDAKVAPDPAIIYESMGVYVLESSGLKIEDNEFYQNYSSTALHDFRGIWQYKSPNNQLIGNEVTGVAGPNTVINATPYRGIYIVESGNTFMSCNSASGLNRGVDFEGPNCDGTDFRYNVMSNNIIGLYLADGTIIGQQYEKENRWPGNLPPGGLFEALYDGSSAIAYASTFFINDPNTTSDFWAVPRQPLNLFDGTPNSPSGVLFCFEGTGGERELSASDEMAIAGTFPAHKGYPASVWEAELRAFAALAENPDLRPANSAAEAFYTAREAGVMGSLYRAKRDWEGLYRFTPALEAAWADNRSDIEDKLETIRSLYAQLREAENQAERDALMQSIAETQNEISDLQQTAADLADQYADLIANRAQQLALDLSLIDATEVWEQNVRTVLALQVEHVLTGAETWTTGQYNALKAIADQCRHEGGIGVVMARAAIDAANYDDAAMCPGYTAPRSREEVRTLTARLMPNPASDHCRLLFEKPLTGMLQIANPQGQTVHRTWLKERVELNLDTRNLPAGIYQIEVRTEDGQRSLSRLSIVH